MGLVKRLKILVTGSTGYIGRNLVKELTKMPSITIYGTTRDENKTVREKDEYNPVVLDMNNSEWTSLLPNSIDVVVHLAQSMFYREFPEKGNDIFQVNAGATLKLLEWARKNSIKRFIFASTGNVYQDSLKLQKETSPCLPGSMYAVSKLSAENIVRQYGSYFQTTIMRIFTVYGPNQKNRLIPNTLQRIKDGAEITLAEGVGVYMTPIYISDAVEMIKRLVLLDEKNNLAIYNLCGSEVVTLANIIKLSSDRIGIQPNVRVTEEVPVSLQGDNKKLCDAIGYKQNIMINEGLGNMITFKTFCAG